MGFRDRFAGLAESVTGRTMVEPEHFEELEETYQQFTAFRDEAEDLAIGVMDYVGGRPQEMQAMERRRLAQRSRIALIHDPLAGAEANLLANFAFGRGVPKPQANDKKVQEVIDEAWDDPINARKLTTFEAQRHRSNDLLTSANLYPVMFEKNGKVRIGFLDGDLVTDIITDPDDDEKPLWYVTRRRKVRWDFENHRPDPTPVAQFKDGQERVYYYRHWQADEMDETEGSSDDDWGDPGSAGGMIGPQNRRDRPKAEDIAEGEVEHFRINRIGRTQFGVPPWARTLRYFSAMNQLGEARVAMAQGAASLIAKRTRKGGPNDILKAASNVQSQAGELATARFGARAQPANTGPGTNPQRGLAPPPAGSFWLENEGDRLEAVRLSSGGGEATSDAQIIRAPIAAATGFGQHYLGDASNANLATATTLELPTHMTVSAWQETFEGLFTWFTDRVIEAAVKSGRLGGMTGPEGKPDDAEEPDAEPEEEPTKEYHRPLKDLSLEEDQQEMEDRTGLDLSYSLEMPYPGRRNLPDVSTAVTSAMTAFGSNNDPLREIMLDYLFRHGLQLEDPAKAVEDVMAFQPPPEPMIDPATGLPIEQPPGTPPPNGRGAQAFGQKGPPVGPGDGADQSQYGEKRKSTPPVAAGLEEGRADAELIRRLMDDADEAFAELLGDQAAVAANGRKNGASGPGSVPG